MKDSFEIPLKDIEPTETPGVFRVNPSQTFRAWIEHQKLILIVEPVKEEYERWKRVAAENPNSWEAKVLNLPENQNLLDRLKV